MRTKLVAMIISYLSFLIFPSILLGGITVKNGATITVRSDSVLDMNCTDLDLSDGGNLIFSGSSGKIENARNIQLGIGSSITGDGIVELSGTWQNDGDYIADPSLTITFFTGCSTHNNCIGTGDTDNDGRSDKLEGIRDRNSDNIYDFLDAAVQSYICDIDNDNDLDLTDVILGLRLLSGIAVPGVTTDIDINQDGRVGQEELMCVFTQL